MITTFHLLGDYQGKRSQYQLVSTELVFVGNTYVLAEHVGGTTINSPVDNDIGNFDNTSSTTDVDIVTTNTTSDTIRLPGGKAYKLTAYINVNTTNAHTGDVKFQFWLSSLSSTFGAEGVVKDASGIYITSSPASALFYTTSPVSVRLQLTNATDKIGLNVAGTYILIESL